MADQPHLQEATVEELAAMWPHESWSIGKTGGFKRFIAHVHGHGVCAFGRGDTAREAMESAICQFREKFPDEMTAKRRKLEQARQEVAQLEADLQAEAA